MTKTAQHHPNPDHIDTFAAGLDQLAHEHADCRLDYDATGIRLTRDDGLSGGPAAWYVLATGSGPNRLPVDNRGYALYPETGPARQRISMQACAETMAQDLGFDNALELEDWAHDNPGLWGNDEGRRLFRNAAAYSGASDLATLSAWWKGIAKRLRTATDA